MSSNRPVALVTGAANGIGRATTEHLLRDGWTVHALDVDAEALRDLPTQTAAMDVTDPAQWHAAVADLDRLDLLVNNAGLLSSGPFIDIPAERHRRIVEVNVLGVVNGALACYPALAKTPGSVMVNLGSTSATYGQPDLATYSATKFAIRGLTEALDLEWAEHDIRVLDLWPSFVATAMVDGMHAASGDRLGIHLSADDVAVALLAAVTQIRSKPAASRFRSPHIAVGRQARLLAGLGQVSPHRTSRLITKLVTGR